MRRVADLTLGGLGGCPVKPPPASHTQLQPQDPFPFILIWCRGVSSACCRPAVWNQASAARAAEQTAMLQKCAFAVTLCSPFFVDLEGSDPTLSFFTYLSGCNRALLTSFSSSSLAASLGQSAAIFSPALGLFWQEAYATSPVCHKASY